MDNQVGIKNRLLLGYSGVTLPLQTKSGKQEGGAQGSTAGRAGDLDPAAILALTVHDLRNYVNGIVVASQFLLEDAAPLLESDHISLLKSIESSGGSMFRLLDVVKEALALQAGELRLDVRPTNVLALIEDELSEHRRLADSKNVRLQVVPTTDVPRIAADPVRIRGVIDTLLTNTIYSSAAGTRFEVIVSATNDRVVISIRPERAAFPVQADQTTKKPTPGKPATILAFRVAKRIVEEHGGKLETEGDGSILILTMPIARESTPLVNQAGGS
jgi:signal transduction histidine kinase